MRRTSRRSAPRRRRPLPRAARRRCSPTRAYVEEGPRRRSSPVPSATPRRVRGAAPHGRDHGREARRAAERAPASSAGDRGPRRRSIRPRPATCRRAPSRSTTRSRPRRSGARASCGIALADYVPYLDERATFLGQWGLKPSGRGQGVVRALVETEGRPRLRMWLDRVHTEGLLEAAVVWLLPVRERRRRPRDPLHHDGPQQGRAGTPDLPAPAPRPHLCLSDFFRPRTPARPTSSRSTWSRWAPAAIVVRDRRAVRRKNAYRDYLELHGLSVQLTEALAEMWHARAQRARLLRRGRRRHGRPHRRSRGYPRLALLLRLPACPDVERRAVLVDLLEPSSASASSSRRSSSCTRAVDVGADRAPPEEAKVLQRGLSPRLPAAVLFRHGRAARRDRGTSLVPAELAVIGSAGSGRRAPGGGARRRPTRKGRRLLIGRRAAVTTPAGHDAAARPHGGTCCAASRCTGVPAPGSCSPRSGPASRARSCRRRGVASSTPCTTR